MKTIQDTRLANTTSLPDEVSLEAVVSRKAALLAATEPPSDESAEVMAVRLEQENARRNAQFGIAYLDEPGRGVSSTIGAPTPAEQEQGQ